ncbi:GntR family transcriptional regulator [Leptobacterium flavescens]|uniref:GntR family transcriptional regulator n=1 Tax=Leptobacterium flavescens TaxID=472055 RepID=A0A6P0UKS5_9FLAO|nr:S1-like domain-containing RNA-binding protein [Leptobacterium flavescens]NER13885.1 GntR family transcriptional regulator [Leptobacterium flavescens]
MIKIGEYNELEILRDTDPGLFLGDEDGNEILLPNKYVPDHFEIGDTLEVFCYLDHEERPVATTLTPQIQLNDFALLKAVSVTSIGAFMDWGLEKHLFVPFKEQALRMVEGKWYLIYCYMDEMTDRLVGSSKTNRFISNEEISVEKFEEVDIIISRHTELGEEVIINKKHKGLIYNEDLYRTYSLGEKLKGYVKKVRSDNKIDIVTQQIGYKNIEPSAEKVLEILKENKGFLALHDKSHPEEIKRILEMSKKSFKKAIGSLYKQKMILIKEDGIYLN